MMKGVRLKNAHLYYEQITEISFLALWLRECDQLKDHYYCIEKDRLWFKTLGTRIPPREELMSNTIFRDRTISVVCTHVNSIAAIKALKIV